MAGPDRKTEGKAAQQVPAVAQSPEQDREGLGRFEGVVRVWAGVAHGHGSAESVTKPRWLWALAADVRASYA